MQPVIIALMSLYMFYPQQDNPSVNWRIIADNEAGNEFLALVSASYPSDLNFPLFYADNQNYSGRIESGNLTRLRQSSLPTSRSPLWRAKEGRNQGSYYVGVGNATWPWSSVAPPPVGKLAAGSFADSKSEQTDLISVLKDIFRNEGVPHNLVWLAEVESSLNPNAESKAGAVGLFQLMPATAERFGLQLFPVDDRKTPDKSARAAACYLRQLYKEFGGWALALAAYNAGEGRVSRTMKLHNARTFCEVAPHLPSETRKYVPRVMVMMALREDQNRGMSSAAGFQP